MKRTHQFLFFDFRFLNKADFNDSFSDESYWKEVSELKNLYPESDERPGLLELVGQSQKNKKVFDFFYIK